MDHAKTLHKHLQKLQKEFSLVPIMGCELEFYTNYPYDKIAEAIGLQVVAEEGKEQAEIRFLPTTDIYQLAKQVESTKKSILRIAKQKKAWASFKAKPFEDRPGSAMQIHLNFLHKDKLEKGATPQYLNWAIGGLLHTLCNAMPLFAPTKNSYKRYVQSMTTPTTISWGRNNRTAALRIILGPNQVKRIEHRVPGADADALAACTGIILGAYTGIKKKLCPPPETHGLTFSECYDLPTFSVCKARKAKDF